MKTTKIIAETEKTLKTTQLFTKAMIESLTLGWKNFAKQREQAVLKIDQKNIQKEHLRLTEQLEELKKLGKDVKEAGIQLRIKSKDETYYSQNVFRHKAELFQIKEKLAKLEEDENRANNDEYYVVLRERDKVENDLNFQTSKLEQAENDRKKAEEKCAEIGTKLNKLKEKHNREWTSFVSKNEKIFNSTVQKVEVVNEDTTEVTEVFQTVKTDINNNAFFFEEEIEDKKPRNMNFITCNPDRKNRMKPVNQEDVYNNLVLEILDINQKFELALPGLIIEEIEGNVSCYYEQLLVVHYEVETNYLQVFEILKDSEDSIDWDYRVVAQGVGQNLSCLLWLEEELAKSEFTKEEFEKHLITLYKHLLEEKVKFNTLGKEKFALLSE